MAKGALGRGLGALLGEIEEAYENELSGDHDIKEIALGEIKPNPYQPRKNFDQQKLQELADSIKSHGLLQPIVVVKDSEEGYLIVAGERRFRASKLAKTKTIRAIVVDITQEQMREHALIENIQREELNIIELANAYEELIKVHNLTHDELAKMIHKSRASITNTLRLLQLSKKVQKALGESKISMGHAKVMLGLSEKEQQVVMNSIIGQKLSVREVEATVKSIKSQDPQKPRQKERKSPATQIVRLKEHLNALGFTANAKSNAVTVTFGDESEAEKLLELLLKR